MSKSLTSLILENLDAKGNLEIKSNFIISNPFFSSIILNPSGEKKFRCSGGVMKMSLFPRIYLKKELKFGTAMQRTPPVSNNLKAFLIHIQVQAYVREPGSSKCSYIFLHRP